jgi:hypothetical protein
MSQRYPGGVITKSPTAPTQTAASGVWTLEQVAENVKNATWPPNGPFYVEDVFSTYLYPGNGSTQTINNGINLSGKGGLVWIKGRTVAVNHCLFDTHRGVSNYLNSNTTDAASSNANFGVTSFSTTGFSVVDNASGDFGVNGSGGTYGGNYVSWAFRKQPKFFDIVTYTGNGTAGRAISHSLGSTPGFLIVKGVSGSNTSWRCWHQTQTNKYLTLNGTGAAQNDNGILFGDGSTHIAPTSTTFTVSSDGDVNANGATYVAYLFAHDAGGFGDAGDQSIVSCGSYVAAGGSTAVDVNIGWEPQWVLRKASSASGYNWAIVDSMRGLLAGGSGPNLYPNLSNAESNGTVVAPKSTGFDGYGDSGVTYIYVAIRRPMRSPTTGSSVFTPVVYTGTNTTTSYTGLSFSPDLVIGKARANTYSPSPTWTTKILGTNRQLGSSSDAVQTTATDAITGWLNNGYSLGADNSLGNYNLSTTSNNYITWNFRRAPGVFDVVAYTGDGGTGTRTIGHSLGTAAELVIIKTRTVGAANWIVGATPVGWTKFSVLNSTNVPSTSDIFVDTAPTSSVFSIRKASGDVNESGRAFVAYLFASRAGISKIGSYTGNGSSQTIDCGFTAGARFVLIKRTSASGDWYLWDTARGIISNNDPHISLNTTAAEVTSNDSIDPDNSGFIVNQNTTTNINVSSATYLYLAIA